MDPKNLRLPVSLRDELKHPIGQLIKGTIESTIPILIKELSSRDGILVGVGDVTADVLVHNSLNPEIVITDGFTKREKLLEWNDYPGYKIIETKSPAAEITDIAWISLKEAIKIVLTQKGRVHIKVEGEEDLLVIPLLIELPIGSVIVYGQPNEGAVLRIIDEKASSQGMSLLNKMEEFA